MNVISYNGSFLRLSQKMNSEPCIHDRALLLQTPAMTRASSAQDTCLEMYNIVYIMYALENSHISPRSIMIGSSMSNVRDGLGSVIRTVMGIEYQVPLPIKHKVVVIKSEIN